MSAIPFTQYLRPDGRRAEVSIDRPDEVAGLAAKIIERGFRFECEHLTTGHTSLTIVGPNDDGDDDDLDIAIVMNGPKVPGTIDEMVKRFASKIGVAI